MSEKTEFKYVYGPVPSRRLGRSLGVSPIPNKTCNYSCIYCQLGRTPSMTNERKLFYNINEVMDEVKHAISCDLDFDVITIVGEGEPTLYSGLGVLIDCIHDVTDKPVAVITNGALLSDLKVQNELNRADFVLPSLDAVNEEQFKRINRPHKQIEFHAVIEGLISFSKQYQGELWLEMMLLNGINDDLETLSAFRDLLKKIHYTRLYINSPVRPPAESGICEIEKSQMEKAIIILGGISIDLLSSIGFSSQISDDFDAILSIIQRHPMNQFEIDSFLKSRGCTNSEKIIERLNDHVGVARIVYKGYDTYRITK